MKEYKYGCDGGCILIGTKSCRVNIPNNYGDGKHTVSVYSEEKESKKIEYRDKWKWVGTVEGSRINVYNYDCLTDDELSDKKNILCTLKGRYAIYVCYGDIALVKWD